MGAQLFKAYSIGKPLLESLAIEPFSGYIAGVYRHSCNIIAHDGRVISLVMPSIGNAPFSIIVNKEFPFASITPKMRVYTDLHGLEINNMPFLDLTPAECWEPKLIQFSESFHLKQTIATLLNEHTVWHNRHNNSSIVKKRLSTGAVMLHYALSNELSVRRASATLAGLGFGLTPSGDDYILGVMVSLWLTGNTSPLHEIFEASHRKTTSLSAALFSAGSKGNFAESWHQLVEGILSQNTIIAQDAINRFAQIGAYSGRDSLAGFATHLLGSKFSTTISANQNTYNGWKNL
jgi:hypothetical protein